MTAFPSKLELSEDFYSKDRGLEEKTLDPLRQNTLEENNKISREQLQLLTIRERLHPSTSTERFLDLLRQDTLKEINKISTEAKYFSESEKLESIKMKISSLQMLVSIRLEAHVSESNLNRVKRIGKEVIENTKVFFNSDELTSKIKRETSLMFKSKPFYLKMLPKDYFSFKLPNSKNSVQVTTEHIFSEFPISTFQEYTGSSPGILCITFSIKPNGVAREFDVKTRVSMAEAIFKQNKADLLKNYKLELYEA